jgi:hypothetical protein
VQRLAQNGGLIAQMLARNGWWQGWFVVDAIPGQWLHIRHRLLKYGAFFR